MAHVIDAEGRVKGAGAGSVLVLDADGYIKTVVPLASLADYVRGRIIRGGADWEAYAAETLGAVLIGDGTDVVSDTTPTLVGLLTLNAGALLAGGDLNFHVAGDTYPQASTQGLNARFEDMFGDDVPTRLTDFVRSTPLGVTDAGDNERGFLTDTAVNADSHNPIGRFSKSNPGAVWFYVKNHHLYINSLASTANFIWNHSTPQNYIHLFMQFMARRGVPYGGEIRVWDTETPGGADKYWAARFVYDTAGYPDWPWRVKFFTGTGTTFAIGDGTERAQAPWPVYTANYVRMRIYGGPRFDFGVSGYHSQINVDLSDIVVAGQPVQFKRVQIHVATSYQQCSIDSIVITA